MESLREKSGYDGIDRFYEKWLPPADTSALEAKSTVENRAALQMYRNWLVFKVIWKMRRSKNACRFPRDECFTQLQATAMRMSLCDHDDNPFLPRAWNLKMFSLSEWRKQSFQARAIGERGDGGGAAALLSWQLPAPRSVFLPDLAPLSVCCSAVQTQIPMSRFISEIPADIWKKSGRSRYDEERGRWKLADSTYQGARDERQPGRYGVSILSFR